MNNLEKGNIYAKGKLHQILLPINADKWRTIK